MKQNKILAQIENAKPLDKDKVRKAIEAFNEKMEIAKIEFQKQNRDGEILAAQARLTT